MKLFVYDPGTTTGLVTAEIREGSAWMDDLRATMELYHVKAPTEVLHVRKLWDMVVEFKPTHIVGEDFVLLPPTALKGRAHSSDRRGISPARILLGMDLMLSLSEDRMLDQEMCEITLYVDDIVVERQMPGEKEVITDKYLRIQELWRTPKQIEGAVTGDSNHAMDALRHLIVYMRKTINRGGRS